MNQNAVCKHCGSDDLLRDVEIVETGWRRVEAAFLPDGSLTAREHHTAKNCDGDETPLDYACGACGAHAAKLEDLIVPEGVSPAGKMCCCGHSLLSHPEQKHFDRARYVSGRRSCTVRGCGCWEFETDPALATVVSEAA